MLPYPNIDPVAVYIPIPLLGTLPIRWYGLMYVIGFGIGYLLIRHRAKQQHYTWTNAQISDLIFYIAVGVIVGGRVGYMLFYNFSMLLHDPLSLFAVWRGGMSFHGGLLGSILAIWLWSWRYQFGFLKIIDFCTPLGLPGIGAGRIGNFIGAELYGRPTDVPWAMVFPTGGPLPRHPSQLYEFLLEGVLLFIILWWYSNKPKPAPSVFGLGLLGYGSFRFLVEFTRAPDSHLGFVAFNWMSMGQALSIPMIVIGFGLIVWSYSGRFSMQK